LGRKAGGEKIEPGVDNAGDISGIEAGDGFGWLRNAGTLLIFFSEKCMIG
jgi:hypothetical protein